MINVIEMPATLAAIIQPRPEGNTRLWWPVDSDYVEAYWLPVIGPTAWSIARRLYTMCKDEAYGVCVITEDLFKLVGVKGALGARAVARLVGFGVAFWPPAPQPTLALLGDWPDAPRRYVDQVNAVRTIPGGPE